MRQGNWNLVYSHLNVRLRSAVDISWAAVTRSIHFWWHTPFKDRYFSTSGSRTRAAVVGNGAWIIVGHDQQQGWYKGPLGRDKSEGVAEAPRAWSSWDTVAYQGHPSTDWSSMSPKANISVFFLVISVHWLPALLLCFALLGTQHITGLLARWRSAWAAGRIWQIVQLWPTFSRLFSWHRGGVWLVFLLKLPCKNQDLLQGLQKEHYLMTRLQLNHIVAKSRYKTSQLIQRTAG